MSFKAYVKNFYEMQDMAPVQHRQTYTPSYSGKRLQISQNHPNRIHRLHRRQIPAPCYSYQKE